MAMDEVERSVELEAAVFARPLDEPIGTPQSLAVDSIMTAEEFTQDLDHTLSAIDPALLGSPCPEEQAPETDETHYADFFSWSPTPSYLPPLQTTGFYSEPTSPYASASDGAPRHLNHHFVAPRALSQPPEFGPPAVTFHREGTPVGTPTSMPHPFPAALKAQPQPRQKRPRSTRYHPYEQDDQDSLPSKRQKRTNRSETGSTTSRRNQTPQEAPIPSPIPHHTRDDMFFSVKRIERLAEEIREESGKLWANYRAQD